MATATRVPQASTWDCGLAAAASVLGAFAPRAAATLASLTASWPHAPFVWTVDLALILAEALRDAARVEYCSRVVDAVNPALSALPYYAASFDACSARLPATFAAARRAGVLVSERRALLDEVRARVERGALVIALVNSAQLRCIHAGCLHWRAADAARDGSAPPVYTGHFVTVTAFCDASVALLDPARGACAAGCAVGLADFEAARACDGTDDDLILIEPAH